MYNINKDRLITTFTDLVQIPSPSWKEKDVMNYVIKKMKGLPVKYKKIKCNDSYNLLISMEGALKKRPILFSAHMDTVVPCENIKPVIKNNKITSDGSTILGSDDKSAIAAFIEGLYYIKENNMPHGPIEILLSCAEEIGLYGIKNFDTSLLRSKSAFVFDSSGSIGTIILKAPFHSTFNITIKGKAAHAGIEPENGINSINVLSEIITKLPSGRIDFETTLNVGIISGGKATNIVADSANCILEIRSINRKKLKKYEAVVKKIVQQVSSAHSAKPTILQSLEYSGFSIHEDDEIIKILKKALHKINIKPGFEISGGGSDTNIFNKQGIKAINLSSGMQKVHTNKEYIMIKDLINCAKLMLSIIDSV